MENKIREFWSSRLKQSRGNLLKKCLQHCKQESVPEYATTILYQDKADNYDIQVLKTYKCVQDGTRIVTRVKNILLQTSKLNGSSVDQKWIIVQV